MTVSSGWSWFTCTKTVALSQALTANPTKSASVKSKFRGFQKIADCADWFLNNINILVKVFKMSWKMFLDASTKTMPACMPLIVSQSQCQGLLVWLWSCLVCFFGVEDPQHPMWCLMHLSKSLQELTSTPQQIFLQNFQHNAVASRHIYVTFLVANHSSARCNCASTRETHRWHLRPDSDFS